MAVKVMIPTPLRQFTGKQSSVECNAATVGEALGSLTENYAELRKHLFTDEGKIRSFVNVYLNDEDIRFLQKENTRTKDGDTISIVPSIAGGSPDRESFLNHERTPPTCHSERSEESLFGLNPAKERFLGEETRLGMTIFRAFRKSRKTTAKRT